MLQVSMKPVSDCVLNADTAFWTPLYGGALSSNFPAAAGRAPFCRLYLGGEIQMIYTGDTGMK